MVYDGRLADVVTQYAPTRLVRVHLAVGATPPDEASLAHLGSVAKCSPSEVCLRVPRDHVAEVAGKLLAALPVKDLAIEEDDVGTLIERIQQGQTQAPEPPA